MVSKALVVALVGAAAVTTVVVARQAKAVGGGPLPQLTTLSLSSTPPTSIATGGSVTFNITAKDQNGAPMPGVNGQMTEGGTPVAGATFTTGSAGTASIVLQFPTAGTFQVGATSGNVNAGVVTVMVTAPTLSSLAITSSDVSVKQGGSLTFTVTAKDQTGVPMPGVTGQFVEGGTAVPGTSFTTGAGGTAVMSIQFAAPGSFVITAVSGSVTSNAITVTVVPPPVLTSLSIGASATSVGSGGVVTITVTAKDQNGLAMPGVSGQLTEGGTPVPGATFTTGTTGTAKVSLQFPAAGQYLVAATSGTITSNAVTITVTAVSVASVKWGIAPITVIHGVTRQWQALVTVKSGSPVGIPVDFFLDGKLAFSAQTSSIGSLTEGAAYFNASLTLGTHTLYFTAGGLTSPTLTITAT